MDSSTSLVLIDSDYRRRAAICHMLAASEIHVEPFEDVGELGKSWPTGGIILIEDTGSALADLFERMAEAGDWLPVIGFSHQPDVHRIVGAIHSGAVDYLAWPAEAGAIAEVIRSAASTRATVGSMKLREARARSRIQKLTNREREVLIGVAGGLSNRKIGEHLSISPRTVEIHRANMLDKMGANHTSDAIRLAIEAALVD